MTISLVIKAFKSRIFALKSTQGNKIAILAPKRMLQRIPIAPAQLKTGNTSEDLLKKCRQIVYSLYRTKDIIKKYDIILN